MVLNVEINNILNYNNSVNIKIIIVFNRNLVEISILFLNTSRGRIKKSENTETIVTEKKNI